MNYVLVTVSGIHTQVAMTTYIEGYTIGVIYCLLPNEDEIREMTEEQIKKWTIANNKRMKAICKLLNDKKL